MVLIVKEGIKKTSAGRAGIEQTIQIKELEVPVVCGNQAEKLLQLWWRTKRETAGRFSKDRTSCRSENEVADRPANFSRVSSAGCSFESSSNVSDDSFSSDIGSVDDP
jgi:hypothetical protein